MIALLTTYLVLAYVFIPGFLFRWPASFFVQLRAFHFTRTQEVTFGATVSIFPFLAALLLVWNIPPATQHPFHFPPSTVAAYKDSYRSVLTLTVAADPSKLLTPVNGHPTAYATALKEVEHRQFRFLFWFYLLVVLEGILFGSMTRQYGNWVKYCPPLAWFTRKVMLPRISEWQLLLTPYNFPGSPRRDVYVDVLCRDLLYRGQVGDYFLDSSGKLSGILLKRVERFRKADYEQACLAQPAGRRPSSVPYWRDIPGANFYIPYSKITNLNVRFPYADSASLQDYIENLLEQQGIDASVTVSLDDFAMEDEDAYPAQEPPSSNQES